MTTDPKAELLQFLQQAEPSDAARAFLKRTAEQFILEYGWWYEPAKLPNQVVPGTPGECHMNATNLMVNDASLIYCEGYALFKSGIRPTIHAWVTDGQGRALENTWASPGLAYAGVPFRTMFILERAAKHIAAISLLDDWQNRYPLLRDLGDRPDEWLEQQGRGEVRLSEG